MDLVQIEIFCSMHVHMSNGNFIFSLKFVPQTIIVIDMTVTTRRNLFHLKISQVVSTAVKILRLIYTINILLIKLSN